jgi:hypothetical protein
MYETPPQMYTLLNTLLSARHAHNQMYTVCTHNTPCYLQ